MNTDQISSIVRTVLKIGSGIAIAHGLKDTASILNMPDIAGVLTLILTMLWSHFSHSTPSNTSNPPGIKLSCFAPLIGAIAFAGLLTTGCQSPKLEQGGAYAPATTNVDGTVTALSAPDMALFVADTAYKIAYDAVDGVLKYEYENRAELSQKIPSLKPALDKIRPQVWKIEQDWAVARTTYMANPTPANLGKLQTILGEIQRLVPAVQAVLSVN